MTATDPAVQATAEAFCDLTDGPCAACLARAEVAVAAARPHIAAAVRAEDAAITEALTRKGEA